MTYIITNIHMTNTFTHSHSLTLTLSRSHALSLARSHSRSRSCSCACSHFRSLSLTRGPRLENNNAEGLVAAVRNTQYEYGIWNMNGI